MDQTRRGMYAQTQLPAAGRLKCDARGKNQNVVNTQEV